MPAKKSKPKLEKKCCYHEDIPASYICGSCGKSICIYCQKNTMLPYQCPECMPEYWGKKVKKERIICWGTIGLLVLLILISIVWLAFYTPEYDGYSDIYVENQDVIPIVHIETFNLTGNNEIDLTLKVYVTNSGTKTSGDVFIELFVMSNGISRADSKSGTKTIKEDETRIFIINTTIIIGEYDLQLMIWEDNMVVQKGLKGIKVTGTDIEEISAFEIIFEQDDDAESKEAEGFSPISISIIVVLVIGLIIIIVIGWFFLQQRAKPPKTQYIPPFK